MLALHLLRPADGFASASALQNDPSLSPLALAVSKDARTLFVACATANRVLRWDVEGRTIVASIAMPAPPSGLALSTEGASLFVTCAAPESRICIVDLAKNRLVGQIQAGHTATAPVLSPDGKTLFVCNRFNNDVSAIDLQTRKTLRRIAVSREPVAEAITPNGKYLLVANLLPDGRADADRVAAAVSVIDAPAGRVTKSLQLPDGSSSLNDISVSPDGKFAVVTHILSRFRLPANQVERGWMNVNAMTIIDVGQMEILNTVLLDEPESGAANPWGAAWSRDGRMLTIVHAGTHEVSVIDFPAVLAKLAALPAALESPKPADYGLASRVKADVPNDLAFLSGSRRRIKLPFADRGPRAIAMVGSKGYVANYFSDTLTVVDIGAGASNIESIRLGQPREMSLVRKGELYFHDATLCFQSWQSCSTCHPGGARVDGLNWDLTNDGVGNPKNVKSLLFAHRTPPAMSLGVREGAETAVRAGLRHILFAEPSEPIAAAIDEYLKSLRPVPSPYLVQGKLSKAAERGKKIFHQASCAKCHPAPLFTDLHQYDVGTRGHSDGANDIFDTPTLIELWRTAPYLHDGSAATVRDVLISQNPLDQHGRTSKFTSQDIDDLRAYLLSL